MRMTGTISVQFSVPMDVEIKGDDIEANLELEAFKLLKLDDVQKANIDLEVITDQMREVEPMHWLFWRQHCLGCIEKDATQRMADRMLRDDRNQAVSDIAAYLSDESRRISVAFALAMGGYSGWHTEQFAENVIRNVAKELMEADGIRTYLGFSIHDANGAPYPDVDDCEEAEE